MSTTILYLSSIATSLTSPALIIRLAIRLTIYCRASRVCPFFPISSALSRLSMLITICSGLCSMQVSPSISILVNILLTISRALIASSPPPALISSVSFIITFTRAGAPPIKPNNPALPSSMIFTSTSSCLAFSSVKAFCIASSTVFPSTSISFILTAPRMPAYFTTSTLASRLWIKRYCPAMETILLMNQYKTRPLGTFQKKNVKIIGINITILAC